jgi:hypothetical protein
VEEAPPSPSPLLRDFPDLRKIIERDDNWKEAFASIFPRRDILVATLSELEPIRNTIAHSRKATMADAEIVHASYAKIEEAIGIELFRDLSSRLTTTPDIPSRFIELRSEATYALKHSLTCRPIVPLEVWPVTKDQWWFDPDYLKIDIAPIERYFAKIVAYIGLPRVRGTGHSIESWVRVSGIEEQFRQIEPLLDHIIAHGESNARS